MKKADILDMLPTLSMAAVLLFMYNVGTTMMGTANYYVGILLTAVICVAVILIKAKIYVVTENICMIILLILTIIGVVNSGGNTVWPIALTYIMIFGWLALFLGSTKCNKREIRIITDAYIISAVIIAGLVIFNPIDYIGGRASILSNNEAIDPNFLSSYLSFAAIICFDRAIKNKKNILVAICLVFLISLAILFTGSRAGYMIVAIGFSGIFFEYSEKSLIKKITLAIFSLLSIFLLYFLLQELLPDQIFYRLFVADFISTNDVRFNLWLDGFRTMLRHPIRGYGIINTSTVTINSRSVHNSFIGIWMHMGIGGLITFGYLLISLLRKSFSQKNYVFISMWIGLMISAVMDMKQFSLAFWAPYIVILLIVNHEIKSKSIDDIKTNNPE